MHRATAFLFSLAVILAAGPAAQAQTPTTTIKNANGNVVFQSFAEGQLLVPGRFNSGSAISAKGAGTRLLWWPHKAAFRAGRVGAFSGKGDVWDADSIGNYSVALGVDTKANARAAVALGEGTTASSSNAVAIGYNTKASGFNAVALGKNTAASGSQSTALGGGTTASGNYATAMGNDTEASALIATAMGAGTVASGFYATAMGNGTLASGETATAMGSGSEAKGVYATAMGRETIARAEAATALGNNTIAATNNSLSVGAYNDRNRGNDDSDPTTGPLFVVGNGSFGSRSDAFYISQSGGAFAKNGHKTFSDRRLKTGIAPLGKDILQKLSRLRPVRYEFKNQQMHPSGTQIGLVAQDVQKEFPSLVSKGPSGYLSLAYPKLTAVLLKGLQEQQRQIEAQKKQLRKQRATISSLKKKVRQIETLKTRVARLESQSNGSVLAGLSGTTLLAVLLALGGFGAGVLWRRRA